MQIYILLPIIFIAAAIGYSLWARKRAQNMDPAQAAEAFHEHYSEFFTPQQDEKIVGTWGGVEYQGAQSIAGQAASAALNSVSAAVVGVSTYVPNVQIGLTSGGRVLISREYSDMGERGNFKQVKALAAGTCAVDAASARPGQALGSPPKNPFNPLVSLEFVKLLSPEGDTYEVWLSPQGACVGHDGFSSIFQALNSQTSPALQPATV